MPINLISPHKVVYIPFGMTSTAGGTAVVASTSYRMFVTDAISEILSIQLVRNTGLVGTVLYTAGSLASTAATGALTSLATTTAADTATTGLINLPIDVDANDSSKGPVVPPGTVIGFKTDSGTVTTSLISGVIIKYRST